MKFQGVKPFCLSLPPSLCRQNLASVLLLFILTSLLMSCGRPMTALDYEGGYLLPSVYYLPTVSSADQNPNQILTPKGQLLGALSLKDFNNCKLQGSCVVELTGGKTMTINYAGDNRFNQLALGSCPTAMGANQKCLVPFHSIAADLSIHTLGEVIYIPALVGLALPGGEIHDGYFVISDSGSNIYGADRFDFFTGSYPPSSSQNPFSQSGINLNDQTLGQHEYTLISGAQADLIREKYLK